MSRSGYAPWKDDIAADWFGDLMDRTGFVECIAATLEQEVDEVSAREIRAAAFVLLCLGRTFIWPIDHIDRHLKLAADKLAQCIEIEESRTDIDAGDREIAENFVDLMRKELAILELMQVEGPVPTEAHEVGLLWQAWLK